MKAIIVADHEYHEFFVSRGLSFCGEEWPSLVENRNRSLTHVCLPERIFTVISGLRG